MKKQIIAEIKNRNQYASHAKALSILDTLFPSQERAISLKRCNDHIAMIDCWLALLPDQESYLVQRRMIDGVDWFRVKAEYHEKWGIINERADRTMRSYLENAVSKIAIFVEANEDMRALLFDTDIAS